MIIGIFNYLEKKKGKPIPLSYKLLYNLPLNENDLIVNSDLKLWDSKIEYLPNNLTVNGHLELSYSNIKRLPNNLIVEGSLYLYNSNIKSLPDDLIVNGNLWCYNTPLANNIKNDVSLLNKYSKQIKGQIIYE